MIRKILLGLGFVIALILIIPFFRSAEFLISREIVINSSPEVLFPYINNAQKSYEWMPWAESDPGVEIKFTGAPEGVGAKSSWDGKQMGTGSSEVIESIPNQSVKTTLVYTKPFEMSQVATVSLAPTSAGTKVTWSVDGHNNYFFKLIGIFIDCDKMVGDQFLQGLNKLKKIVEAKK